MWEVYTADELGRQNQEGQQSLREAWEGLSSKCKIFIGRLAVCRVKVSDNTWIDKTSALCFHKKWPCQ